MNFKAEIEVFDSRPMSVSLAEAETRLLDREHPASFWEFEALLLRMRGEIDDVADAEEGGKIALRICQRLFGSGRSFEALPFSHAALSLAQTIDNAVLLRRSHTANGLLLADTADIAGAIEHHTKALRLAAKTDDVVEMSRVWNNIGCAFCIAGNFALAASCFRRVLALLNSHSGPIFSRYTAFGNLAHCLFHLEEMSEGHHFAVRALEEMTAEIAAQDPYNVLLLYRNYVRLLIALNRLDEAKAQVESIVRMASRAGTPRASIAAATAQAALELASGDTDLGLTRLDQALVQARSVPAALRDTLVCVIRAEEKAGFPAHALVRMQELSNHIYAMAVGQIRSHVELTDLLSAGESQFNPAMERARARLTSSLSRPAEPPEWKTLSRLAVSAALRIEETGWHGIRVGALTQALATEHGCPPLQALEFGLAAQIHDIGMLSVPEKVLSQSGSLNDVERMLVHKHTQAGGEMLADDRHSRILIARDVAKFHHAHWDGSGHPANVARESIPLAARMCAVADTYDTLVTDRPYRKACSMADALLELKRVAGTQLDPGLVASFEKMIRREAANEGIDPSAEVGLEGFQQLICALTEDRGFL